MTDEGRDRLWLRFYGPNDLASYWHADEAAELVRRFSETGLPNGAAEVIQLHNARLFVEAGIVPRSLSEGEVDQLTATASLIRSAVARYFTSVDDSTVDSLIQNVPFEYHTDLLLLLGNNRAFERVQPDRMLANLADNEVNLATMLGNKKLVRAYDRQIRGALLEDLRGAELLVRRNFAKDPRDEIHLPASLTPADARALMARYVAADSSNPNYLSLIETAPINAQTGVDARLKLDAKRRRERETKAFFSQNDGMKSGAEVRIEDEQEEPVIAELDGMVATFSYGRAWLESTLDHPSVLNTFQHLFEFADRDVLLTLPAYKAELGVFERFLMTTGNTDYHYGVAYRVRDMSSTIQTQLQRHVLSSTASTELEEVVAWFFREYLPTEFGARGFGFSPPARDSSFLEKTRHLLVEMESVVHQFTLYVEDGAIDRDLLAISSDNVRYAQIPSLIEHKYLYATDHEEIQGILFALFSDQSSLRYINESLRAENLADLLIGHSVAYDQFERHQRGALDRLIELGILRNDGTRVRIANAAQFLLLRSLYASEAASYAHQSPRGRALADEMVQRGWLSVESTLLTSAEASYFNFHLNKFQFHNGPELRNKYLHGSQANADDEDAHFSSYLVVLKLFIALVIKINDDFALAAREAAGEVSRK